jgi:hypothetical protein
MANFPIRQERRRWKRHWLNAPVRILSDRGVMEGFGLHVSEGGMYLFAVADFEPGTQLDIEYRKPKTGERTRSSGVVQRRMVYLYAVEFLRNSSQTVSGRFQTEAAIKS